MSCLHLLMKALYNHLRDKIHYTTFCLHSFPVALIIATITIHFLALPYAMRTRIASRDLKLKGDTTVNSVWLMG